MNVTITLVNPGADAGPFNIYTNDDNYIAAVATNVAKSALVAGYNVWVPPLAVTVKVECTGTCTSAIFLPIAQPTTTTTSTSSTTTTTTTEPPETTTTTTTYFGPPTTSTTTTVLRYNISIALVNNNLTCSTDAPDETWWSYTSIPNGYYKINNEVGNVRYYIQTLASGTYNPANQITNTVLATCNPVAYYYYLAEVYYCPTCSLVDPENPTQVVFATVANLPVNGKFFTSFNVSNYVYKVIDVAANTPGAYQISTEPFTSCAAMGCGTVTTTVPRFELNEVWAGYNATDPAEACVATPTRVYSYSDFTGADAFYVDIYGDTKAPDGYYSAPVGITQTQRYRQQYEGTLYSGALVCS